MAVARKNLSTCFVEPFMQLNETVLYRLMAETIRENEDFIKRLNQERLYRGENTDGSPIKPAYTLRTVAIKKKKGQPTDRTTLRDKGDVYDKIFTDVFSDSFSVDDADPKFNELVKKYGPNIVGMSQEDKAELAAHIKPQYIAKIRQFIGI